MINASITVESGENIESIIRRWKKSVDKAGVMKTHARTKHFIPASQKRADKSSRARKKRRDSGL